MGPRNGYFHKLPVDPAHESLGVTELQAGCIDSFRIWSCACLRERCTQESLLSAPLWQLLFVTSLRKTTWLLGLSTLSSLPQPELSLPISEWTGSQCLRELRGVYFIGSHLEKNRPAFAPHLLSWIRLKQRLLLSVEPSTYAICFLWNIRVL